MSQRFFLPELSFEGRVLLTGDEAHHAISVMRVKPGDEIVLFDGNNNEAVGTVDSVSRKEIVCQVEAIAEVNREADRLMIAAVAMPKGDRARSVIEKAVELGAWGLVPIVCKRSIALPSDGQRKRWQRYVIDASKQCGRNRLMQISESVNWEQFPNVAIDDVFAAGSELLSTIEWSRVIAHPSGPSHDDVDLGAITAKSSAILFAVGPEGGFEPNEVESATKAGWQEVSFGLRILRVETAVGHLLSIAQ